MFFRARKVHFIGIGGSGMSGIAEVLLNLQYEVTGCDARLSPVTERLERLGARIAEGHDPRHVQDAEAVVTSSAVRADNAEVLAAHRLQIPVIPRGEMLAELMRLKFGVAIAGSHGKTTTTSMVASILAAAGLDPTLVVGGRLNSMGSSARLGKGDFMVVESDESDRSFLHLSPILAVITSIDREHLDCYGSLEELRRAYVEFANKVPFYGAAILCVEDANVRGIVPELRRRVVTYGMETPADLVAREVVCGHFQSRFELQVRGENFGRFELRVPGRHNVLNALAAAAIGLELKILPETIREALGEFGGVERRFQVRGIAEDVTVVDDYGHHPTESRATLDAARDCGYQRILAVFQPHRYTRTALLFEEFAAAFDSCHAVWVMDIYPAGEAPIEGVSSKLLAARMREQGNANVEYAPEADELPQKLLESVQPGDLVLTLGAGTVWQVGERFLERLRAQSGRRQGRASAVPEGAIAEAASTAEGKGLG